MDVAKPKKKNIPKPTNFGGNLKFLRKESAISQTAFAKYIGISRNSIASYENGLVEPNASNFLKICNYFDLDAQAMLQDTLWKNDSDVEENEQELKSYIVESFTDFLTQTNEMAKVLDGYKEFYSMRRQSITNDSNRDLLVILDDLVALLKSLVEENRKLIKNVLPPETESRDMLEGNP